jgi:hypothetical protein
LVRKVELDGFVAQSGIRGQAAGLSRPGVMGQWHQWHLTLVDF